MKFRFVICYLSFVISSGVRSDRPAVGTQLQRNRGMTLERRGEILVDLNGAAPDVVMGNGDNAESRRAGPAHAAREQAIAEAELPLDHVARLFSQGRSLHTGLYIKNDASNGACFRGPTEPVWARSVNLTPQIATGGAYRRRLA